MESQAYQNLVERLNRIEQYVERTSHLLQDIDEELEMSTTDLSETLMISESTLYRGEKRILFVTDTRTAGTLGIPLSQS